MSLRDQAIQAMYEADGERVGERVFVEKALDALLLWLRENDHQFNHYPKKSGCEVVALCDLLSKEDDKT